MSAAQEAACAASVRSTVSKHGLDALELEWRLGHSMGTFRPGVSEAAWERLRAKLDASPAFAMRYVETHEGIADGVRRSEAVVDGSAPPSVTWVHKKRVADYDSASDVGPWSVRASVSAELQHAAPPRFQATYERHKRRWSYRHDCWSVDLTRVRGNGPNHLDADSDVYEVEIELGDREVLLDRPLDHIVRWGRQMAGEVCALMLE